MIMYLKPKSPVPIGAFGGGTKRPAITSVDANVTFFRSRHIGRGRMKFESDEQRRAVTTKLARTRPGKIHDARPDPAEKPRERRLPIDPEEFVDAYRKQMERGDRDSKAGDLPGACFHYHQAAEAIIKGASSQGYEDTHNIRRLLAGLPRPVGEALAREGARLTDYYGDKPYGRERDLETGKEIPRKTVTYTQDGTREARRIAARIAAFCQDMWKAEGKSR